MVILRLTRKMMAAVHPSGPVVRSDTALGDWYVNRLVVDRQPLLLLVSALSLLAIVELARNVRKLPDRLPDVVRRRLVRLGIDAKAINLEIATMSPVTVAPTVDRSVVGIMVDFAKLIPSYLPVGGWDAYCIAFCGDAAGRDTMPCWQPLRCVSRGKGAEIIGRALECWLTSA